MKALESKIYIYNTLQGKKEVFKPLVAGKVGMYVCGPTVYGEPHLGHARSAITFDVVFRYFKFLGYQVRYVRNITDVGHLEDEQNESGEDKIAKKARLEQLEPMEVAQYYTNLYRATMQKLNVSNPSIEPTASGHIIEQIQIVQDTIKNGLAYEVNGSVYFDVQAYAQKYHYGILSGRVLEDLMAGTRSLEGQSEKKHPADFALWKKAEPEHIMQWESPWGKGFPGWHIECTAMSSKYLGIPFDIHGGGMDLKFPHHEAEIAQSIGAFGCQPVNYWMHNNMMTLDGQKMAKSKGNFISLEQMFNGTHPLLEKAYSPMNIRFFMLQAHYSSTIDFSNKALQAAETALKRLTNSLQLLSQLPNSTATEDKEVALAEKIKQYSQLCYDKMNDDFNTAEMIACLFELSSVINILFNNKEKVQELSKDTLRLLQQTYQGFLVDVLGILPEQQAQNSHLEGVMEVLIQLRNQARKEKNYALSDAIRNALQEKGIRIKDTKDGQTIFEMIS